MVGKKKETLFLILYHNYLMQKYLPVSLLLSTKYKKVSLLTKKEKKGDILNENLCLVITADFLDSRRQFR